MKNGITLLFILLIFLSCKQKQTVYDNTKDDSEIRKIVDSKTEKVTERKVVNVISERKTECELKTLVTINSLLEKGTALTDQNFADFFANMGPDCSNNAEFSEFNNELIFRTLESNPKKFVAFLSRISKKKKVLRFVLNQLRNPINDGIELNEIFTVLRNTKTEDSEIQTLIVESLDIAIEKYK